MAAYYQSNLLGDFFRKQGQRRALTGLPSSYQETRGTLDPILQYDAQKSQQAGLLAQRTSEFDRQMQLQEKARKDQATAGMVGGVGQLSMLPLAYQSAKGLGWIGGKPAAASAGVTAQGAVAPAAAGTTAQAGLLGAPMAGAAPYSGAGGLSYGALGGEVGGGLGVAGSAPALTAGAMLAPAAGGLLGGAIGSKLAQKYSPIGGQREKQIGGGIAGGAAAGAAIGSVVPGVGTLIGGAIGGLIGGISSLF